MSSPIEHLLAAIEIAEEGERDESGFLTEESRQAVQRAYGSVGRSNAKAITPFAFKRLQAPRIKGICQRGERSDLTGCTPASGEAGENKPDSESANNVPDDLREIAQRPGMLTRINRMVKLAKSELANVMVAFGDLAPAIIPNAYDHARNALLSTAVPGVPVNDIALALSKVIAWTWKKAKANAGKSLSQNNAEQIREMVKILYAMLDLPEDTPLPSDEQIAEVEKKRGEKKAQTKDMSAYDTTNGGALVGAKMPLKRRKLIHSMIGYQSKKLSPDADTALRVIKQVAGQYNLAPIVAVRRALATAGFSSRGQQDTLINELRRAMRVSASGFEGRHGISKEEQDAAIVEGTTRLGFISLR